MSSKNYKASGLDYTNAITDSHNEDSKALNVVAANNLVPSRFGKVDLTYITSGLGAGNVGQARYYSDGVYQETRIQTRGDSLGTAHKTTLNFINKTPSFLSGKSFVVYDNAGAVKVWFNVDFSSTEPVVSNTYRSIVVNLLSSHTSEVIASRTAQAFAMDASFVAVYSLYYTKAQIDSDVIKKTGVTAFTADQSMGGYKLSNVANPVALTDAVNLQTLNAALGASGDILENSFSLANGQSSLTDITSFIFPNATVRSFDALVSVSILAASNLYETIEIKGIQKDSGWQISISSTGDVSGVILEITSAGQMQYITPTYSGFTSGTLKFRAITTSI